MTMKGTLSSTNYLIA